MPTSSERLNQVGNDYFNRGHYTDAFGWYQRALELDRQSGDQRALLTTLGNLGNICAVSGRRDQATSFYQEVLELQKKLGDERGIGVARMCPNNSQSPSLSHRRLNGMNPPEPSSCECENRNSAPARFQFTAASFPRTCRPRNRGFR